MFFKKTKELNGGKNMKKRKILALLLVFAMTVSFMTLFSAGAETGGFTREWGGTSTYTYEVPIVVTFPVAIDIASDTSIVVDNVAVANEVLRLASTVSANAFTVTGIRAAAPAGNGNFGGTLGTLNAQEVTALGIPADGNFRAGSYASITLVVRGTFASNTIGTYTAADFVINPAVDVKLGADDVDVAMMSILADGFRAVGVTQAVPAAQQVRADGGNALVGNSVLVIPFDAPDRNEAPFLFGMTKGTLGLSLRTNGLVADVADNTLGQNVANGTGTDRNNVNSSMANRNRVFVWTDLVEGHASLDLTAAAQRDRAVGAVVPAGARVLDVTVDNIPQAMLWNKDYDPALTGTDAYVQEFATRIYVALVDSAFAPVGILTNNDVLAGRAHKVGLTVEGVYTPGRQIIGEGTAAKEWGYVSEYTYEVDMTLGFLGNRVGFPVGGSVELNGIQGGLEAKDSAIGGFNVDRIRLGGNPWVETVGDSVVWTANALGTGANGLLARAITAPVANTMGYSQLVFTLRGQFAGDSNVGTLKADDLRIVLDGFGLELKDVNINTEEVVSQDLGTSEVENWLTITAVRVIDNPEDRQGVAGTGVVATERQLTLPVSAWAWNEAPFVASATEGSLALTFLPGVNPNFGATGTTDALRNRIYMWTDLVVDGAGAVLTADSFVGTGAAAVANRNRVSSAVVPNGPTATATTSSLRPVADSTVTSVVNLNVVDGLFYSQAFADATSTALRNHDGFATQIHFVILSNDNAVVRTGIFATGGTDAVAACGGTDTSLACVVYVPGTCTGLGTCATACTLADAVNCVNNIAASTCSLGNACTSPASCTSAVATPASPCSVCGELSFAPATHSTVINAIVCSHCGTYSFAPATCTTVDVPGGLCVNGLSTCTSVATCSTLTTPATTCSLGGTCATPASCSTVTTPAVACMLGTLGCGNGCAIIAEICDMDTTDCTNGNGSCDGCIEIEIDGTDTIFEICDMDTTDCTNGNGNCGGCVKIEIGGVDTIFEICDKDTTDCSNGSGNCDGCFDIGCGNTLDLGAVLSWCDGSADDDIYTHCTGVLATVYHLCNGVASGTGYAVCDGVASTFVLCDGLATPAFVCDGASGTSFCSHGYGNATPASCTFLPAVPCENPGTGTYLPCNGSCAVAGTARTTNVFGANLAIKGFVDGTCATCGNQVGTPECVAGCFERNNPPVIVTASEVSLVVGTSTSISLEMLATLQGTATAIIFDATAMAVLLANGEVIEFAVATGISFTIVSSEVSLTTDFSFNPRMDVVMPTASAATLTGAGVAGGTVSVAPGSLVIIPAQKGNFGFDVTFNLSTDMFSFPATQTGLWYVASNGSVGNYTASGVSLLAADGTILSITATPASIASVNITINKASAWVVGNTAPVFTAADTGTVSTLTTVSTTPVSPTTTTTEITTATETGTVTIATVTATEPTTVGTETSSEPTTVDTAITTEPTTIDTATSSEPISTVTTPGTTTGDSTITTPVSQPGTETGLKGDLNDDGVLDINDVIQVLRYLAGMTNNLVDADGNQTAIYSRGLIRSADKIEIGDAVEILRWIAGMSNRLVTHFGMAPRAAA
jgi:hypothetical protein